MYLRVARLRVKLDLKGRDNNDLGQVVWIVLRDTSEADAVHPTVAETKGIIEAGSEIELTIDLPDNALEERHRYSLWAHVDHVGDGAIHPGDLITTENIPVVPSDTTEDASAVQVRLQRI